MSAASGSGTGGQLHREGPGAPSAALDLRLLEIFCCVYEARSFSRAGERLHLAQPTVSGHIKSLEESFGTPLFDRLGREIQATRAGELLYGYARRIVELKRLTVEGMNRFLERLEGRLTLGASTIPGEYLLPRLIGRFREACPDIQVCLIIRDTREIVEGVKEGWIELGLVGAQIPAPGLAFTEFAADRLILVAPPTPAWESESGRLSLAELKGKPLLVREEGSGTRLRLERRLRELGHDLADFHIVAELGSTTAIKEAVKAGVGASVISSLAVRTDLAAGWLRRLDIREIGTLERSFFTVVGTARAGSPLRQAFEEYLSAHLPESSEKPI